MKNVSSVSEQINVWMVCIPEKDHLVFVYECPV